MRNWHDRQGWELVLAGIQSRSVIRILSDEWFRQKTVFQEVTWDDNALYINKICR